MMEFFCEDSQQLKVVNYFHKKLHHRCLMQSLIQLLNYQRSVWLKNLVFNIFNLIFFTRMYFSEVFYSILQKLVV